MFEHDKYFYFIQIVPTTGTISFRNYTDDEGNTYQAFSSLGATFREHRPFWITFSARERTYRTSKEREVLVSKNGDTPKKMKLKDYLLNSPFTAESPNLRGEPLIKLFDEVKDAKTAIDRREHRLKAGNLALGLTVEETTQMAQLIGVFNDDKLVQKNRVLEYADQEPDEFINLYNSPDREARSLVRKGLASGVLKLKGKMVVWESTTLGADIDDAVSKLLQDKVLMTSVAKAVKKLK